MTFSDSFEWGPDGKPREVGRKHDPENRECPWYFDNHKHQNGKGCTCPEREEKCEGKKHGFKGCYSGCSDCSPSSEPKVCPECQYEDDHGQTCSKYVQKDWSKGPPTSVTGDEWSHEKYERMWDDGEFAWNGNNKNPINPERIWQVFIEPALLAQRTHIKQALLGRYQEQKKEARHIHNWSSSQVDKKAYCDGIDEAKLIVNEELA